MKSWIQVAATAAAFIIAGMAHGDGKGQSIMFENQQGSDYKHLTTMPKGSQQSLGDRCMEMSREIESLKGKPQRRSSMMERYRQECELR